MKRDQTFALATAILIMAAHTATAQVIGGVGGGFMGGGGQIMQLINWVIGSIIVPLLSIAVIGVGVKMLSGEHRWSGAVLAICGAVVIANYQTIAAYFQPG